MNSRQVATWVGFFDLLGTKDSAKARQGDFPSKIDRFGRVLAQQAIAATTPTRLRFFADSAYIQCGDAPDIVDFSRRVRKILFGEDIFFKCALGPGELDEKSFNASTLSIPKNKKIDIEGKTFGPSVTNLYYAQEEYKGVGIRISGGAAEHKLIAADIVESAFPRDDDIKHWVTYKDLAYTKSEIGEAQNQGASVAPINEEAFAFLDNILVAAMRANAHRKHLSRYYISTLLTAIASSDFSSVEYVDNKWLSAPPVFHHLFVNRRTRQNYLSLAGCESLYFFAANRLLLTPGRKGRPPRYEDGQQDGVCNAVVSALMSLKILTGTLKTFPSTILDPSTRENIVRRAVALRMG